LQAHNALARNRSSLPAALADRARAFAVPNAVFLGRIAGASRDRAAPTARIAARIRSG
jgi:hypothetical protein